MPPRKSTIAAALFRLCELESGVITLDGRNLAYIGLGDVRGRKNGMSIIPQDPVLFSGSLRECLDPWGMSSDDDILEALQAVQVADAERRGLSALDDFVDEGGRNFSVGERQLLCLARAGKSFFVIVCDFCLKYVYIVCSSQNMNKSNIWISDFEKYCQLLLS